MSCKTDTYPVQSNIHFPTDINLLWDSLRCTLGTIRKILIHLDKKGLFIEGWRKIAYNLRKAKKLYKRTANIHQRKGGNYQARL